MLEVQSTEGAKKRRKKEGGDAEERKKDVVADRYLFS